MRKIITLFISQLLLAQVSQSQLDHVTEGWNDTWQKYIDAKNENEKWVSEVKTITARIAALEAKEVIDLFQISKLKERQTETLKRFRKSQNDYTKVCVLLKIKNDSLRILLDSTKGLNAKNENLTKWVDSFLVALKEEKIFTEKLKNEKKQFEKLIFFKGLDLELAQFDNSYFSSFDIGYRKLINGKVMFLETSKDEISKPLLNSLEYLRCTGNVYGPPTSDTLRGFILIYNDDKLFDQIPRKYVAEDITSSYSHYVINEDELRLNKKIKPRSNIKIAYVTDESFHTNRNGLEDFNIAYRSGYFVISSKRLEVNYDYPENAPIEGAEVFVATDTISLDVSEVIIKLCTDGDSPSGEYVSLSTKDTVVENIRLLIYEKASDICTLKLEEGINLVKLKALSISISGTSCNLWIYIQTKDGIIKYKKHKALKKGDVYGLFLRYNMKFL
jgi:hypothetical protein